MFSPTVFGREPLSIRQSTSTPFKQFGRGRPKNRSNRARGIRTVELATANQMAQGAQDIFEAQLDVKGEENWQIDLDWYSIGHGITSEHLTANHPMGCKLSAHTYLRLAWVKVHEHTQSQSRERSPEFSHSLKPLGELQAKPLKSSST